MDESQLLQLAEDTSAEEANATLAETKTGFTTTHNALQPADYEVEQAQEREGRIIARGTTQANSDAEEMADQYSKLFRLSSKTNYDTAAQLLVLHDARQRVIKGVANLAREATEAAKARRRAAGLTHLRAELAWVRAKAIVEAQALLALVRPLLEFDQTVNVDASGKLSVYISRIAQLETEINSQGVN